MQELSLSILADYPSPFFRFPPFTVGKRLVSDTEHSYRFFSVILTVRGGGVRERRQSTCTLQVNGKRISSPNHPETYPSNGRCEYTIRADAGCKIRLRFSHFALENPDFVCYDWLRVYDGETLLGEFCGTDLPDDLTSSGSIMRLDFRSDSTGQYSGFAVKYKIGETGRENQYVHIYDFVLDSFVRSLSAESLSQQRRLCNSGRSISMSMSIRIYRRIV